MRKKLTGSVFLKSKNHEKRNPDLPKTTKKTPFYPPYKKKPHPSLYQCNGQLLMDKWQYSNNV